MIIVLGMAAFVVILIAGGVVWDWRQGRRHTTGHDISAAARHAQGISQSHGMPTSGENQSLFRR